MKLAFRSKIGSSERLWRCPVAPASRRKHLRTNPTCLFTGIVQGKAQVQSISSLGSKVAEWDGDTYDMRTFKVAFPKNSGYGDMRTVTIGASIALNGTCLTVTETDLAGNTATFDVIEETLKRTNLGSLREGSAVNFERSARVGDEIGGHTVSGHVQTTARIDSVTTGDGKTRMDFSLSDPFWKKYVLQKGFVSIDGCSLTVGETTGEGGFCVYLIPETLRVTVLGDKAVGDFVNVEVEAQTQAIVDTVERVLAEREANMH